MMADWKNRIVGYRVVKARDLTPNDNNWRKHPKRQKEALTDVLDKIGWIAPVLYNVRTGRLIDGHLRQSLDPNADVPVVDVDLSEEEERLALATFDPLANMAETDGAMLKALLEGFAEDDAVSALVSAVNEQYTVMTNDDAWANAFGALPTGGKSEFSQMTFTLHEGQLETVKKAMDKAKKAVGDDVVSDNANSNGNALYMIARAYLDG